MNPELGDVDTISLIPGMDLKRRSNLVKEQNICKHLGGISGSHLLKNNLPQSSLWPQNSCHVYNILMFTPQKSHQFIAQSLGSCYLKSGLDVNGAP